VIVLLAACSSLQAQFKYQGSIEGGVVNGNWETNGYVQTTHGIQYQQWLIGVGAGMDYYRYRSVPVFLEVQKNFGKKTVRPFLIAAAGVNATWPTEEQKQTIINWWQTTPAEHKNGWYAKLGAGVLLNASSKLKFSLRAAYSFKSLSTTHTEFFFVPWPQPTTSTEITTEYRLNRVTIGLGIGF